MRGGHSAFASWRTNSKRNSDKVELYSEETSKVPTEDQIRDDVPRHPIRRGPGVRWGAPVLSWITTKSLHLVCNPIGWPPPTRSLAVVPRRGMPGKPNIYPTPDRSSPRWSILLNGSPNTPTFPGNTGTCTAGSDTERPAKNRYEYQQTDQYMTNNRPPSNHHDPEIVQYTPGLSLVPAHSSHTTNGERDAPIPTHSSHTSNGERDAPNSTHLSHTTNG